MNPRMIVFRAAAFAAAFAASSCAAPVNDGSMAFDPTVQHPIFVEPAMESLQIPFAGIYAGISPADADRLAAFARDFIGRGNGAISISAPRGGGSDAALTFFAEKLAGLGVPRSRILVGTREMAGPQDPVEISFITYVARTNACGDWSENLADTASNLPPPDFGCATQHNIAAMVADPRDLLEPRPEGPSDTLRRMTVIEKYREGQATPADKKSDQSGAVSTVTSN